MKKLLLSLALVAAGVGFVQADTTVEFLSSNKQLQYDGTKSGNNIQPLKSLTNQGVTITFTKDNGDAKGSTQPAWYGFAEGQQYNSFRCYGNNTFTIAAPAGQTISKIEMTFADNFGANQYANLIAETGTITPQVDNVNNKPTDGMTITWTGSASSVKLAVPNDKSLTVNGKTPQCQMVKIIVTLGGGGGPVAPTAPQIKGAKTFYGANTAITMTAQTGADIYYTMSTTGAPADPTASSPKYEGEIVINATTYFKAIAVKDGLSSTVAEATFTKGQALNVASIADFLEQSNDEVCTFTNPVTVVGLYNKRYLFVQDATGYLQIFCAANTLDRPYRPGQTIKGFTVKRGEYNKTPQGDVADFAATFPATAEGTEQTMLPFLITPVTADVQNNLNRLVYIKNVKITKDGNNYYVGAEGTFKGVQLFDRFSLKLLSDALVGKNKDVEGYAVMFNTTPEIFITKVGEPNTIVSVDGIEAEEGAVYGAEGYVVAPEGAQVYNMAGMRVANEGLAAGIYLVRSGAKTYKVVVR